VIKKLNDSESYINKGCNNDFFLKYAIIMTFTSIIIGVILIFWSTIYFPDFSWTGRTLSNLGSVTRGTQYISAPLFNASYIISGLGSLPLNIYYAHEYNRSSSKPLRRGTKILVLPPIVIAIVGIASESYGDIHNVFSNIFFFFLALGVLFMAIGWWKSPVDHPWAIFSLIILIIGGTIWGVYFIFFQHTWLNQALFEFSTIIDYAILAFAYSYKAYKLGLKIN
jgi:hypothetical membrane protein